MRGDVLERLDGGEDASDERFRPFLEILNLVELEGDVSKIRVEEGRIFGLKAIVRLITSEGQTG